MECLESYKRDVFNSGVLYGDEHESCCCELQVEERRTYVACCVNSKAGS